MFIDCIRNIFRSNLRTWKASEKIPEEIHGPIRLPGNENKKRGVEPGSVQRLPYNLQFKMLKT